MDVVGSVLYGLVMDTTATNLLVNADAFRHLIAQQDKTRRVLMKYQENLEPLIAQAKQFARLIELLASDPKSRLEMHLYRKAEQGNTPSIAKILQRLINYLSFLNIIQSINSHPQAKPNKVSSRLHTLGVIPCAPNAFA